MNLGIAQEKSEPARVPMRIVVLIAALIAVSVTSKLIFTWDSGSLEQPAAVLFLGFCMAEVVLLGCWTALGSARWILRALCAVSGAIAIWMLSTFQFWEKWVRYTTGEGFLITCIMVGGPMMAVVFSLVVLRLCRAGLALVGNGFEVKTPGWQFGIRHIMIATALAAGLFTASKLVRQYYESQPSSEFIAFVVFTLVVAVGYSMFATTAVGACFTFSRPWLGLVVVTVPAIVLSFGPLVLVPTMIKSAQILYCGSSLIGCAVVVMSLFVVRSCGYRLLNEKQRQEVAMGALAVVTFQGEAPFANTDEGATIVPTAVELPIR